jgi:CDGSH-type Zn-finger protein
MSDDPVVIRCRPDGPYVVTGAVKVVDHLGNEFTPPAGGKAGVALCRCGGSGSRPFCDGSHRASGFRAAETAPPPAGA